MLAARPNTGVAEHTFHIYVDLLLRSSPEKANHDEHMSEPRTVFRYYEHMSPTSEASTAVLERDSMQNTQGNTSIIISHETTGGLKAGK